MEVPINAQRYNWLDQGFKCFARHLAWGWPLIVFTGFKAGFDGWCFASYLYSLFVCLACTRRLHVESYRLEESQKIQKSWGATKQGFGCFAKAILMRRIHQNNAPTITSVGHRHTGALTNWGKWWFVKSIRHLKRSDKNLNENEQHCKNRNGLLLNKASKVL